MSQHLLRPTRHWPGMIYNSGKGPFYLTINGEAVLDWKDTNHLSFFLSNGIFSDYPLRIRIVSKGIAASAAHPVLTPIPVWRILVLFSNREGSEGAE